MFDSELRDLKKRAKKGDRNAQCDLAMEYWTGTGLLDELLDDLYIMDDEKYDKLEQKRSKKAFKWFKLAAEQGHVEAQHTVGEMYENGDGVEQSYKEAFKWYLLSAEQGYSYAMLSLGCMYYKLQLASSLKKHSLPVFGGRAEDDLEGVPLLDNAVKWLRLAAEKGNEIAIYRLCHMHKKRGIPDRNEAVEWARKGCAVIDDRLKEDLSESDRSYLEKHRKEMEEIMGPL